MEEQNSTTVVPSADKYIHFGTNEINVLKTGLALFHNKESYKKIQSWGNKFNDEFDQALVFIINGLNSGEITSIDDKGNFNYVGDDNDYINGKDKNKTKALKAAAYYATDVINLGILAKKLTKPTVEDTTKITSAKTSAIEPVIDEPTSTNAEDTSNITPTKSEDDIRWESFVNYMNENFGEGKLKFSKATYSLGAYKWNPDNFENWFVKANFNPVSHLLNMLDNINGSTGNIKNLKLIEATLTYLFSRYPLENFKDMGNGEYLLKNYIDTRLGKGWAYNPKTKRLRVISAKDSLDIFNLILYEWQLAHPATSLNNTGPLLKLAKEGGVLKFKDGGNTVATLSAEDVINAYNNQLITKEYAEQMLALILSLEENTELNTGISSRWIQEDPRTAFKSPNIDYLKLAKENVAMRELAPIEAAAKANGRTIEEEKYGLAKTFSNETLWKTEDWIRFYNLINDISSIGTSLIPDVGTAIAGVQGATSVVADLAADAMDDKVSASELGWNLLLNAGMAIVGMIPGGGGKIGNIFKKIKKILPMALSSIGGIEAITDTKIRNSLSKAITGDLKSITNDDWKNILYGMKSIAFMHNNARAASQAYHNQLKNSNIPGTKILRKVGEFAPLGTKSMRKTHMEHLNLGLYENYKTQNISLEGRLLTIKGANGKNLTITITPEAYKHINKIAVNNGSNKAKALEEINAYINSLLSLKHIPETFSKDKLEIEPMLDSILEVISGMDFRAPELKDLSTALQYLEKLLKDALDGKEVKVPVSNGSTNREYKLTLENIKELITKYKGAAGEEITAESHAKGIEELLKAFKTIYDLNPLKNEPKLIGFLTNLGEGDIRTLNHADKLSMRIGKNPILIELNKVKEKGPKLNRLEGDNPIAEYNRNLFLLELDIERNSFLKAFEKVFSNNWEMANGAGPLKIGYLLSKYNAEDLKAVEDVVAKKTSEGLKEKLMSNGKLDETFKLELERLFPELKKGENTVSDEDIIKTLGTFLMYETHRGKNNKIAIKEDGSVDFKDLTGAEIIKALERYKNTKFDNNNVINTFDELRIKSTESLKKYDDQLKRTKELGENVNFYILEEAKKLGNTKLSSLFTTTEDKDVLSFGSYLQSLKLKNLITDSDKTNPNKLRNLYKLYLTEIKYGNDAKFENLGLWEKLPILEALNKKATSSDNIRSKNFAILKDKELLLSLVSDNKDFFSSEIRLEASHMSKDEYDKLVRIYLGKDASEKITISELISALENDPKLFVGKNISERVKLKSLLNQAVAERDKLGVLGAWKNADELTILNDILSGKLDESMILSASKSKNLLTLKEVQNILESLGKKSIKGDLFMKWLASDPKNLNNFVKNPNNRLLIITKFLNLFKTNKNKLKFADIDTSKGIVIEKEGGILKAQNGVNTIILEPSEWQWYKDLFTQQELLNSDLKDHNQDADNQDLNGHNLNFDLGMAAKKNDAYTSRELGDLVGLDIQTFYDSTYSNDSLDDFIKHYNEDAEKIRKTWTAKTDHAANTETGLTSHNLLFKKMFNLRSLLNSDAEYNIGYLTNLEDVMGTSTWMRRMDMYKHEWENADLEEKLNRVHQIKLSNGSIGYIYKKANGDIAKLTDDLLLELSTSKIKLNNSVSALFSGDKVSTTQSKIVNGVNSVLQTIKPEDLIAFARYQRNLASNKEINRLAMQFHPVLQLPINEHLPVIRNLNGVALATREKAQMLALLKKARTSDAATDIAAILEASNKGAALQLLALQLADTNVLLLVLLADALLKKVYEANTEIANKNNVAQANYAKAIADLRASLIASNTLNYNTYSMALEKDFRLLRSDYTKFMDQLAYHLFELALSQDPEYKSYIEEYNKYQREGNTEKMAEISKKASERLLVLQEEVYNIYMLQYAKNHNLIMGNDYLTNLGSWKASFKSGGSVETEYIKARSKDNTEFNKTVQNGIKNHLHTLDNLSKSTIKAIQKALGQ